MFTDLANPFGTAAFDRVAYPMPELRPTPMDTFERKVRNFVLRGPRRQPHEIVKNFLLTF